MSKNFKEISCNLIEYDYKIKQNNDIIDSMGSGTVLIHINGPICENNVNTIEKIIKLDIRKHITDISNVLIGDENIIIDGFNSKEKSIYCANEISETNINYKSIGFFIGFIIFSLIGIKMSINIQSD